MRPAFVFIGLISAIYSPAQQTSLSGPVEAITFDPPTRSLRAVIGFPGAASFGPALMDSLNLASVAPRQSYGIVFQGDQCWSVAGLNSTKMSKVVIAGVSGFPEGIIWSADGSLAILYSRAGRWLQTISGFPGSATAAPRMDVSSLGGDFTAVAVDASGSQIVVGVSGADAGVYRAVNGQLTRLTSTVNPVSLSFSTDGQTLYALDAATLQVTAAKLNGSGFLTLALPGITNPIAIQCVQDSQKRELLYVAAGSDRMVRVLDVQSQQIVADLPLNFQPTTLQQFGSSSFVLASRSQSANPLWLFAGTPQLGAYFVPAIQLRGPEHRSTAIIGRTR